MLEGLLDLFTKHRNSVTLLLILGSTFAFVAALLLFLEAKVTGIINLQLPQPAVGCSVAVLSLLVWLLALAVAKHPAGTPFAPPEKPAVEKLEATSTAADLPAPTDSIVPPQPGSQCPAEDPNAPLTPLDSLIRTSTGKDLAAFDQAHADFLFNECNAEDKIHWDAWALYQRFSVFGQVDSLLKLREKTQEKECNLYYVVWLAACYKFTSEPGKQKQLLERFLQRGIQENSSRVISDYAQAVEEVEGPPAARDVFFTSLRKVTKAGCRARLLMDFANLLQKLDEKTLAAAAYELAFSQTASPSVTHFNVGYEQSKIGFDYLSLKNYDIHLRKEPDHVMAMNNLGVHCGTFDMPGLSIDYFKRSAEKGETLAMANLASLYMAKGFYTEARENLDAAKQDKTPHENVMTTYAQLQEKITKEGETWKAALKRGIDEQEFMRQYGTAALLETESNASLSGQWKTPEATVVTITQDSKKAAGNWIENETTYAFSAEVSGRSFSYKVERRSKVPFSLLGLSTDTEEGVGYLSLDGAQVTIFCPSRKIDAIGVYKRL